MKDKSLHWILGFILSVVFYFVGFFVSLYTDLIDPFLSGNIISVAFMIILIIGKEVYDCIKPNSTGFSWGDIKFGVGGVVVGIIASNILGFLYVLIGGNTWIG